MVDVQAYLDRIGFTGAARPDLGTLRVLHRAHLLAIPYENLDVQFGRLLTPDPLAAFEKIVGRRRGGWCYEMNGVFGLALEAIGFQVTRMAGGVMRAVNGDDAVGNHLVLRVDLDEPWIADVGFGDGALEPYPLREAAFSIDGYPFRLEALDERWWRFHNHEFGGAPNFDFAVEPAEPGVLASRCAWLQTAPESHFVQNAIVQRFTPDAILQLRGRVLRRVGLTGKSEHLIGSADEFVAILDHDLALDLPDAATLWPRICARHDQLFATPSA
jgi:N-hydroxyarylamine O-acetyltransferase